MADRETPDLYVLSYSCPLDWNQMDGDTARRHCEKCSLSVVDISITEEKQVNDIFDQAREGKEVCVRFRTQPSALSIARSTTPIKAPLKFQKPTKALQLSAAVVSLLVSWFAALLKNPAAAIETVHQGKKSPIAKTASGNAKLDVCPLHEDDLCAKYSLGQLSAVESRKQEVSRDIDTLRRGTPTKDNIRSGPSPESEHGKALYKTFINRMDSEKIVIVDELIELGEIFESEGSYNSSRTCYSLSIHLLERASESNPTMDMARRKLASVNKQLFVKNIQEFELLKSQKKYKEAESRLWMAESYFFDSDAPEAIRSQEIDRLSNEYVKLADIFQKEGDYRSEIFSLHFAVSILDRSSDKDHADRHDERQKLVNELSTRIYIRNMQEFETFKNAKRYSEAEANLNDAAFVCVHRPILSKQLRELGLLNKMEEFKTLVARPTSLDFWIRKVRIAEANRTIESEAK